MTNEVIQNIITRRSIKQYKDQQITDEELQTVLHAGLYAPSGMGMQSPVMVVDAGQGYYGSDRSYECGGHERYQQSVLRCTYSHSGIGSDGQNHIHRRRKLRAGHHDAGGTLHRLGI